MDRQAIYDLIKKYRDNTASESEKQQLINWYRETAYQDAEFPEDETRTGDFILNRLIKETKPKSRPMYGRWVAAASVIVMLGAGLFFATRNPIKPNATQLAVHKSNIVPGGNKAILTLADGSKISLTDASNGALAKQSGIQVTKAANGQLIYTIKAPANTGAEDSSAQNQLAAGLAAYNTIETPIGGQYQVVLADGTKVWLNSVSSIKFPVSFASRKERRVELSGEAYFEVAHNKEQPFRVATSKQTIEVLGTHFNVNAYADEASTRTTLLQGSVKLTAGNNSAVLKPGQQADLTTGIVVSAANIDEAIAWKNGYFRFDDERLDDIMRRIARWYNIKVVFKDESLKNETFGALTTRFADISNLLDNMEQTGDVRFSIDGSTITIRKKTNHTTLPPNQ